MSPRDPGPTRAAILDAAATLLEDRGPESVTLRAVGEAAGVSRSAPYRHYADKAALMRALAGRTLRQIAERIRHGAERHRGRGSGCAPVAGPTSTTQSSAPITTSWSSGTPRLRSRTPGWRRPPTTPWPPSASSLPRPREPVCCDPALPVRSPPSSGFCFMGSLPCRSRVISMSPGPLTAMSILRSCWTWPWNNCDPCEAPSVMSAGSDLRRVWDARPRTAASTSA